MLALLYEIEGEPLLVLLIRTDASSAGMLPPSPFVTRITRITPITTHQTRLKSAN